MIVRAVIIADLDTTPLGTRSRLADDLAGVPVLRRTVERLAVAGRIDGVYVLVPTAQAERAAALLAGTAARLRPHDAPPTPWAGLVRTARKWSLDGWRGGIGGTSSLDEYMHPGLVAALIEKEPCDAVAILPPAGPCLDPAMLDAMIDLHAGQRGESRLTFTQAPPGISGVVYEASLINELAEKNIPPGWVIGYKPDAPAKDLAFLPCCYQVPADLAHASGRLIADTDTAWDRVMTLFADGVPLDPVSIGRHLDGFEKTVLPPLPREVEMELTTDDPYPAALLRPRGDRAGARGPLDLETVEIMARELGQRDDALVVLGGCGDPCRHPQFSQALQMLRQHGVFGLAVRTSGADLSDEVIEALIDHQVDVLTVLIDGWLPDTYAALTCPDDPSGADLEGLIRRMDRLDDRRRERQSPAPIVVPEMIKARQNVDELADFFDGWIRRMGTASIAGYSHCGRQLPDHAVMNMAPAMRGPCRRLRSRCTVLADGRITLCDQDIRGSVAIGSLAAEGLAGAWNGAGLASARGRHQRGEWGQLPLCARCDEWHRP